MTGETVRVFLALPLAEFFLPEITDFFRAKPRQYPDVKWVYPAGVHITLHFFGETGQDQLARINSLMEPVARECAPLRLGLGRVGFFPNDHSPRIVWIGVQGDTVPLGDLAARISRTMAQNGFAVEAREFRPHATVGRVRRGARLKPDPQKFLFQPAPVREIGRIVLYRSLLGTEGARYEILESFELSGRPRA